MRLLLPMLVAAAAVTAQSPLTTTFANNNGGSAGGAVYFELTDVSGAGVTLTDIDMNFGGAAGAAGSIDVYYAAPGTAVTAAGWQLVTSGSFAASAGAGLPTSIDLVPDVGIGPNSAWKIAIVVNGAAHAYTTGTAPFALQYTTAELQLDAGEATNVPFTGAPFFPRVVNCSISYTLGGSDPSIALAEVDGQGCTSGYTSFYEEQSPVAFDLNNTQLDLIDTGAGLVITGTTPSTIDPIGSIDPLAVPLVLGDDVSVAVGTLGIEVFSNCQVAFGAGNDTNWVPSVATLLSNPATALYAWTDLSPNLSGSGQVTYEEDAVNGVWQVTYDGVYAFGTTDPSTVQFRGDFTNGTYAIAFGTMHTTGPENILVGYSVGGVSADPGASDISTSLVTPLQTAGTDTLPLTLAADNRPVVGAAPNPVNFTTSNIDATALFHLTALGFANPGFPLAIIGFPADCFQNADATILIGPDVVAGMSSYSFTAFTLPSDLTLVGSVLHVQTFTLDLGLLGPSARASNGIKLTVGDL